jgi:preprotein translocase subunit YajC
VPARHLARLDQAHNRDEEGRHPVHIALLAHLVAATTSPTASPNSGSGSHGGGFNYSLLVFAVIIGGMFWFMSRNQRRQRQRMADLQSRLTPGQEVMTGSGIYGRIVDSADDRVRVEVSPGVILTVAKQAVVRTVDPAPPQGASPFGGAETGGPREPTPAE